MSPVLNSEIALKILFSGDVTTNTDTNRTSNLALAWEVHWQSLQLGLQWE